MHDDAPTERSVVLAERSVAQQRSDDAQPKRRWGYMRDDVFIALPVTPLLALDKQPPFDVELPTREVRHIIEEPTLSP